jgi:hypothetical protein
MTPDTTVDALLDENTRLRDDANRLATCLTQLLDDTRLPGYRQRAALDALERHRAIKEMAA